MSNPSYLLKNITLPKEDGTSMTQDILIGQGVILKIADHISQENIETYNFENHILLPGLIDLETHICEKFQDIELSLKQGSQSAVKGGFTTICAMSDIHPPLDNAGMIALVRLLADQSHGAKVIPACCATLGSNGQELTEMGSLIAAGAGLIYDAGKTIQNPGLVRHLMEYKKMFSAPLFMHCEETTLSEGGLVHEGKTSMQKGLPGIPSIAEEIAIHRDCLLAQYVNVPIHIPHITTQGSVEAIRYFKHQGVPITCGVTPHHLNLTIEDMDQYNPQFKMNPPLREKNDQEALIEGLLDGTIDCISTNHYPIGENNQWLEFASAQFGVHGLENAFQLVYEKLLVEKGFSLWDLIRFMSINPAKVLGLPSPSLCEGAIADLIIIDLNNKTTVSSTDYLKDSFPSPYVGKNFSSKINTTFVNGVPHFINPPKKM